jgi:hypothetical protein
MLRNLSDQDLQPTEFPEASGGASNAVISLDARRARPIWEREIVAALLRFISFPQDWDSYDGMPLRHDTGMFALQVLSGVMNDAIPLPSIVPVSGGGVQFEWHQNNLDIELYVAAPYECELSVHDHVANTQATFQLKTDLGPLAQTIRLLVDFNRHLNNQAHAG